MVDYWNIMYYSTLLCHSIVWCPFWGQTNIKISLDVGNMNPVHVVCGAGLAVYLASSLDCWLLMRKLGCWCCSCLPLLHVLLPCGWWPVLQQQFDQQTVPLSPCKFMNSMKRVIPLHFISWKTHFLILAGSAFYQIWLGRLPQVAAWLILPPLRLFDCKNY